MGTITFDTLQYVDELVQAGVPKQQAKAQSDALKRVVDGVVNSELATKGNLKDLEIRLIKWLIGSQVPTVVVLATLFKLFSG